MLRFFVSQEQLLRIYEKATDRAIATMFDRFSIANETYYCCQYLSLILRPLDHDTGENCSTKGLASIAFISALLKCALLECQLWHGPSEQQGDLVLVYSTFLV